MASSTPDNFCRAVFGAFALVGLAVCIGMGHSLMSPVTLRADWSANTPTGAADPTAPPTDREAAATPAIDPGPAAGTLTEVPADAEPPASEGHLLDLEQAHAAFYDGAIFLDARPRDEYDLSRVEGAMHLSTQAISSGQAGEVLDSLIAFGYDQPLVLYCHGGDCDASENTAIRLQQMGFTNIRIMTAGFDEWVAAGFEVETP